MSYNDKRKAYARQYYLANRERVIADNTKRSKQKSKEWNEFKASLSCTSCGIQHPAVIDFHHDSPDDRDDSKVHHYVRSRQWKKAYKEAERCVPLCANCHRILHWEERRNKKPPPKRGSED